MTRPSSRPLPPGSDDFEPGTYDGPCGGCAEENHTGGNWGAPHTCGRSRPIVIVTYADEPARPLSPWWTLEGAIPVAPPPPTPRFEPVDAPGEPANDT